MDTAAQIKRNGAKDFISFYSSLCALQNSYPNASIKACAKEGVLNCHLQTLERQSLHPILTALRVNTVLHTVVFYNRWQEKAHLHYRGDVLNRSSVDSVIYILFSSDQVCCLDLHYVYQRESLLNRSIPLLSRTLQGMNLSLTSSTAGKHTISACVFAELCTMC